MDNFINKKEQKEKLQEIQNKIITVAKNNQKPLKYSIKRGYGESVYEILGGHDEWKKYKDSEKIYFHLNENNKLKIGYRGDNSICVAVKKIGGYNAPQGYPDLFSLLDKIIT